MDKFETWGLYLAIKMKTGKYIIADGLYSGIQFDSLLQHYLSC
jgi:hypothetical protein